MAKSADAALAQYKAKEKAKAKAAQAKADAKAANKAAAKPKTAGSNVKVVPEMTSAERAQRNASENQRVSNQSTAAARGAAGRERNATTGSTVSIRTNPGISGKGGTMVGALYRPMGAGGMSQYNK
jgi:membrane protein involved in colicin uptake